MATAFHRPRAQHHDRSLRRRNRPTPGGYDADIGFCSYLYYEYDDDRAAQDGVFTTPGKHVDCAPATAPARS